MKFPGYWVSMHEGKVILSKTNFDDTELDSATHWKQAWQNQGAQCQVKGHVELHEALITAAQMLATTAGLTLSRSELNDVTRFEPAWKCDRSEIQSISHLIGPRRE